MGFFAQNLLDSPNLRFFPFITPGFSPILSGRTSGVLFKHPGEIEVICVTAALPHFPNLAVAFPEKLDGVAHPHPGQIGGEAFLLRFFEHLTDVVLVKAEDLRDFSYPQLRVVVVLVDVEQNFPHNGAAGIAFRQRRRRLAECPGHPPTPRPRRRETVR